MPETKKTAKPDRSRAKKPPIEEGPTPKENSALADTDADDTLLPELLIERLGIVIRPGDHAVISGISGSIVGRSATVGLELATSGEVYRWSARVGFYPGHRVLLGHQGFFDGFTASFNGRRRLLTLTPYGMAPTPLFA